MASNNGSAFRKAFETKDFVVTAEIGPPKGTDISRMVEHIEALKDVVDGLNVTDNQSSVMRISSLAVCRVILDHGGEPILQLTCRDRNRLALQSELLAAWILGVRNVLCLTGDYISVGDHPQAKPVFDLDSVQLLQTVGMLNQGKDLAGNDLEGGTDFFAGAVVTPEADPIEPQMIKFQKKIAAGARFFQTQAIYDVDNFKRFMERAEADGVKIMAGIVLLVSPGMAKYMNKNVPGIFVPDALIEEMAEAPKGKRLEAGIRIAGRMIRQLRDEKLCHGAHIMAIGKEECVPRILEAAE
ncbi:MAG TPA: 5,10-methylenetetrahydrofolate reductase [Planctomycetaceae bacterium]|nr:5,10-methylenetetrahydrofolate reductase [Planctomycetaceae bacterium]HIQ22294.1 5,10-methylenetetrahydrofolate reductase [Planctomycetota bacterium]